MLGERIASQSEVIRSIVSGHSPRLWGPAPARSMLMSSRHSILYLALALAAAAWRYRCAVLGTERQCTHKERQ